MERTEHSDTLHAPKSYIGTSLISNLAVQIVCCPVHIKYAVVAVTCVQTNTIFEVFAYLVAPCKAELISPVVHFAKVLRSRLCANC